MPFPEEFYGQQFQNLRNYTGVPTDEIDLERAINSDPNCFVEMAPSSLRKPLKMVLSPFNARNWTPEKLASILKKLEEMIDQGFEISVWQGLTALKPLTKESLADLASLEMREAIHPTHYEAMVTSACQQIPQTTRDDVFILDDYWLDRVLNPKVNSLTAERNLLLSDVVAVKDEGGTNTQENLLAFFKSCKPKINQVLIDEYSIDAYYTTMAILDVLPDIGNFHLSKGVCLVLPEPSRKSCEKLSKAFTLFCINKGRTLFFPGIETCTKITIGNESDLEGSELRFVPEVLTKGYKIFAAFYPSPQSTDVAKDFFGRLLSAGSNISAKDLEHLVSTTDKKLEELSLFGCRNITNAFVNFPKSSLLQLQKITLKNCKVSKEDLLSLMQAAPHLKEINLSGCENLQDIFSPLNTNKKMGEHLEPVTLFPELKKIDLSFTDVSEADILGLKTWAPNLEEINLSGCAAEPSDLLFQPSFLFSHLKKLTLTVSNTKSEEEVANLFQNAPNLEEIDIDFGFLHSSIFLYFVKKGITLPKLKKISQYKLGSYTQQDIDAFLSIAPNLDRKELEKYLNKQPTEHKAEEQKISSTQSKSGSESKPSVYTTSTSSSSPTNTIRPRKRLANEKKKIDADTHWNPNKAFQLTRIFYADKGHKDPKVGNYRLDSADSLDINPSPCDVTDAFLVFNKNEDLQFGENKGLTWRQKLIRPTYLVHGRQSFDLDDENWQPIASLSAHETMRHHYANRPNAAFEIAYSTRDNQYYIRSKKGAQKIDLEFELDVPEEQPFVPIRKKKKK